MYLPGVFPQNPQQLFIFFKKTATDHCQSRLHPKQTLSSVRGFLLLFIFQLLRHCHTLLASYPVQRERFQRGAGAKCCRGEEGDCVERVCAPVRCQRGGILRRHSLSLSSVILSLQSQTSEFCLPLSSLLPEPSRSHSCDRRHNKNTNLCLFVSAVGDPAILQRLNWWTVLN